MSVILTAGDGARYEAGKFTKFASGDQSPDLYFWANQSLEFRQTVMSEVIEILGRWYHVPVGVNDSSMLNCRLTASFTGEGIERILPVISETFGWKLEKRGPLNLLHARSNLRWSASDLPAVSGFPMMQPLSGRIKWWSCMSGTGLPAMFSLNF